MAQERINQPTLDSVDLTEISSTAAEIIIVASRQAEAMAASLRMGEGPDIETAYARKLRAALRTARHINARRGPGTASVHLRPQGSEMQIVIERRRNWQK